jgi:hypothetical protein
LLRKLRQRSNIETNRPTSLLEFLDTPKSITASLSPIEKKKNWCQISDDYTQYLLGSADTHFQTRSPRDVKEVLLLQENHQLELITLGSPACTTTI